MADSRELTAIANQSCSEIRLVITGLIFSSDFERVSSSRAKFGLPVWLVEFNCGNGWWDCPNEQHHEYMKETLPMLEEMPWVVRYNWMAALTETQFGALNSNVAPFPLTELGETYNQFVWDRVNTHNPQWGDNAGGKLL